MKNTYIKILSTVIVLILSNVVVGQDEALTVPLSNPGSPGNLNVSVLYGSINISVHDGKDVIINTHPRNKQQQKEEYKNGLRKISNGSTQYSVEEYNNKVIVKSGYGNKTVDFDIKVPKNFTLELQAINNGDIYVEGVHGEMEISNTNGAITLKNVGGSVIADALNKNIIVNFTEVTANAAMAFTSLNGDLDISFPSGLKANIKAKTENGEIFTDFDIDQNLTAETSKSRSDSGVYKVTVDKWVTGVINGGGSEILFKTLNGDIFIREQ